MKEFTPDIDLDLEAAAIAEYIEVKWTQFTPNPLAMVKDIRKAALHAARAWVDHYAVFDCVHALTEARQALLRAHSQDPQADVTFMYDAIVHTLSEVSSAIDKVYSAGINIDGKWDYARKVDLLARRMWNKYPALLGARPHGWEVLAKGYLDFDGQAEYDPRQDAGLFKGTRIESSGASHFVQRTSLPSVMYDEKCQGRAAPKVLVGAIFAQFLGIASRLNAEQLCQALRAIEGLHTPEMVFEVTLPTDNPFMRIMPELVRPPYSKEAYLESESRRIEFAAMPPAEQASHQERMLKLIDEFLSNDLGAADKEEALKASCLQVRMLEVFGP